MVQVVCFDVAVTGYTHCGVNTEGGFKSWYCFYIQKSESVFVSEYSGVSYLEDIEIVTFVERFT